MAWMDGIKGVVVKWLGVVPMQSEISMVVRENTTREINTLMNQLWYRGDPVELEQFFRQMVETTQVLSSSIPDTKFWSADAKGLIRKIHSGIPSMIADKLSDIVVNDLMEPDAEEAVLARWRPIACDIDFDEIVNQAITDTLVLGDGAFKINFDPEVSKNPLVEFYAGNNVNYVYKRGKLIEVIFITDYWKETKHYRLKEFYGINSITYELYDDMNNPVELTELEGTSGLRNITFKGDYIMAVPLKFYRSAKVPDRGQSIFERKSDIFDALDETISTWMDAVRSGRVKQYIPENLVPRDADTLAMLKPDVFNNFIVTNALLGEDQQNKIETVQGNIEFNGLQASYLNFLDAALQGLISPSTLGIDVKKLDNAESQREKEKATMYTRDKIIGSLQKALPKLVDVILKTQDQLNEVPAGEYKVTFEFGQYANPSFEALVETMVKAKQGQILSTERIIDELYGDNMSKEEKALEVERIKAEYAAPAVSEPSFAEGAPEM